MATTTNYNWTTPDDTDLVKDGASAIRSLGTDVDTTTKNLNPSTTLGDVEYRSSTANTNTRLGIGTTGQVLTVAGGVPSWATPASGGGITLLSTTTLSGSSTTISVSASIYKNIYVLITGVSMNSTASMILKTNSSNNITDGGGSASYGSGADPLFYQDNNLKVSWQNMWASDAINAFAITIFNNNSSTENKNFHCASGYRDSSNRRAADTSSGIIRDTDAITSLVIALTANSFSSGTAKVYGVS
jgi:hypothetical protein